MHSNLYLHACKQKNTAKEYDIDAELVEVKRDKWQPCMLTATRGNLQCEDLTAEDLTAEEHHDINSLQHHSQSTGAYDMYVRLSLRLLLYLV